MWEPPADHPLRRMFAGLTEHAFLTRLGLADPPLIHYVSSLLSRFVHADALHRLVGPEVIGRSDVVRDQDSPRRAIEHPLEIACEARVMDQDDLPVGGLELTQRSRASAAHQWTRCWNRDSPSAPLTISCA